MNNELSCDPVDHVLDACMAYKIQMFGMLDPAKRQANEKAFRNAASEYKKAIRAAIRSLRCDLKHLDEEIETFTH